MIQIITCEYCLLRTPSPGVPELPRSTPPLAGLQTDDSKLRSKLFGRSLSNKERSCLPISPEPPTLSQSTETLVNEDVGGPKESQVTQVHYREQLICLEFLIIYKKFVWLIDSILKEPNATTPNPLSAEAQQRFEFNIKISGYSQVDGLNQPGTEDVMQKLESIHDDLRRSQTSTDAHSSKSTATVTASSCQTSGDDVPAPDSPKVS